jgi:MFS family permease
VALASALARLPFGMGVVAFVIFVHAKTGSFGPAGAASGAYTLGFACGGSVVGRLVDRCGPRAILLPATAICSTATMGVFLLGEAGAGTALLIVAAGVAGFSTPPISGVTRSNWPGLVDHDDLHAAYLFDSILVEAMFIAGPLITGLTSTLIGPGAPLVCSAAAGLLGTAWFVAIPEIGGRREEHTEHRTRAGALASPTIRLLVLAGVPIGFTFGALDVALPAFGALHGSSSWGGLFAAAMGAGSLLGALAFGAGGERLGDLRRTSLALAVAQPLLCLPILLATSPAIVVPLAMLAGSYAAPVVTARSRIAHLTMPPGTGTETFTWLLQSVMIGMSLGSLIAGHVVGAHGWRLAVILGIVAPIAFVPVLIGWRSLIPLGLPGEEAATRTAKAAA